MSVNSVSYLQLYKFDMSAVSKPDEIVKDFQLAEYESDSGMQFNVIFSQPFGSDLGKSYETEEAFLNDQYFLVQKYVESTGHSSFGIFRMAEPNDPIYIEET